MVILLSKSSFYKSVIPIGVLMLRTFQTLKMQPSLESCFNLGPVRLGWPSVPLAPISEAPVRQTCFHCFLEHPVSIVDPLRVLNSNPVPAVPAALRGGRRVLHGRLESMEGKDGWHGLCIRGDKWLSPSLLYVLKKKYVEVRNALVYITTNKITTYRWLYFQKCKLHLHQILHSYSGVRTWPQSICYLQWMLFAGKANEM